MLVTNDIPLMTGAMSAFPYSTDLEARYVFLSNFKDTVNGSIRDGNTLWVPRESAPYAPVGADYRISYPPAAINCTLIPRNEEQLPCAHKSIALLQAGKNHIVEAPTGWGKCQKKGSLVLMFDGTFKKVEEVVVGDFLMGPDNKPRKVLSLGHGIDPMVKITPKGGEPFWVNEDHVLTLKWTGGSKYPKGMVVDISVKEYLKRSAYFRHCTKLWQPPALEFKGKNTFLISPYVIGLLLGDGGLKYGVSITSVDESVIKAVEHEAAKFGCHLRKEDITYHVVDGSHNSKGHCQNKMLDHLRKLGLWGKGAADKSIPEEYKLAAIDCRLDLLAGLLDSDGSLYQNVFDFISKSEALARDVQFLARSLGLRASFSPCKKTCHNNGVTGDYFRVKISGETQKIPTRLKRKKAKGRRQIKHPLVFGFDIQKDGEGEYYGFALDGDHRYVMGNFLVTHNTVVGSYIAARMGQPTMIVVTKEDLVLQWRKSLIEILGVPSQLVGLVQQNNCEWQGKQFVIGMVQSLIIPDRYPAAMYKHFGMVVLDEVHLMAADCFIRACQLFPARYRLGFSATPERKDGKTRLLSWHIGPVMVKGTIIPMKSKILVKYTGWQIPKRSKFENGEWKSVPIPHAPGRMMLVIKAMTSSIPRNLEIANFAGQVYKTPNRVLLVMSETKAHLDKLFQAFAQRGIAGQDMGYYIGGMSKAELEMTKKRRVVLASYAMCSTGTDVPHWDTLIMATPRSDVKQIIGRVLRNHEGKQTPVILDLVDDAKILAKFHLSRLKQYHEVGAEIVKM